MLINTYRINRVLETVLSTLYIISHSTPIQSCEVETINIPILQMGKLWLKVAWGHPAGKQQRQDLNPGFPALTSTFETTWLQSMLGLVTQAGDWATAHWPGRQTPAGCGHGSHWGCVAVCTRTLMHTALQGCRKRVKGVSRSSQPCRRESFRPRAGAGGVPTGEQKRPARPRPCHPQGRQSQLRLDLDNAHSWVFWPNQASWFFDF